MEDAQRTLETALAGRVVTTMWEGERPVPVRLILPLAVRDDVEKIGAVTVADRVRGARRRCAISPSIRVAEGLASINREGNTRYLALKFNVEGRDMGSVVNDAIATVDRAACTRPRASTSCGAASSRTSSARSRGSSSSCRWRCSPCSASSTRR